MSTFVIESQSVHVPREIVDLHSFRQWAQSNDSPETGRICFLNGEVWVDMSKEQAFTHNKVKGEYAIVLGALSKQEKLGHYFHDGMLWTNSISGVAAQPDGTFVSLESLQVGIVRLVEGVDEGFVEIEGSPDMTLEVVSTSSVHKDTEQLMEAYWEAGVKEYWLVDARKLPLQFDIFRHTPKGYIATRKPAGWIKSTVFGRSFRLTQQMGAGGYPEYTLALR